MWITTGGWRSFMYFGPKLPGISIACFANCWMGMGIPNVWQVHWLLDIPAILIPENYNIMLMIVLLPPDHSLIITPRNILLRLNSWVVLLNSGLIKSIARVSHFQRIGNFIAINIHPSVIDPAGNLMNGNDPVISQICVTFPPPSLCSSSEVLLTFIVLRRCIGRYSRRPVREDKSPSHPELRHRTDFSVRSFEVCSHIEMSMFAR